MARVCFLTERLLRGWGVDHVVHRTADGLARRGHEVEVICLHADRSYVDPAYRVRVLEVPPGPIETLEDRVRERSGLILQRSYDLFVATMYPFFGVASALALPFVYWDFGVVDPVGLPDATRALLARIRREGQEHQRRARRVATISRFLVAEQVNPARRGDTDVIYLGAESYGPPASEVEVRAFRARLGLEPDAEVIGYVGRIERGTYKGVDELAEIAARVRARRPRARLLVVGHGEEAARAHFRTLPGVLVHGNVPDTEMPLFFGAADVIVSASRWEGFNLGIVEGQFYGRPAVAYRLGAHPEVVAPAGALVAGPGEFEDAVDGLLADAEARRRRGAESRHFVVERFTWANTVEAMARCLERAGLPAAGRDPLADLEALGIRPARRTALAVGCPTYATAAALAERFEEVIAVARPGASTAPGAGMPRLRRVRRGAALGDLSRERRPDVIVGGEAGAPVGRDEALTLLSEGLVALGWGGVLVLHVAPNALAPARVAAMARDVAARLASVHHEPWGDRLCVVRAAGASRPGG